jgi:hypothetical protein
MLSPTTFIGIANATAPVGKPAPAAAPGRAPAANSGYGSGNIQPARVLSAPPMAAAPVMPPSKSVGTASPNPAAAPPRNLPRGSLLDLSV